MNKNKKLIWGLIIAVLASALAILFHSINLLGSINLKLSNYLYHEREISDEIVIVSIDNFSLLEPEEGGIGAYKNWDSATLNQIIKNIEKAEPEIILIDRRLSSLSDGIKKDEIVGILEENRDVEDFINNILAYAKDTNPKDLALAETLKSHENIYILNWLAGYESFDGESFIYKNELPPQEIFAEAAKMGFSNLSTSEESFNESTIYAMPYKFTVNGRTEKTLVVKIAEDFLGHEIDVPVERGQMNINYAQKTNGYPRVSAAEVYYDQNDESKFSGKIVLLGVYAATLQDRYYTPIDQKEPMPGVEIQANAIQTILDGKYLLHQSLAGFLIMTFILALASTFAFLYLPIIWASGFLVLEILAYPFITQAAFNMGLILDLIWPIFILLATYLAVLIYRYFTEFAEKRNLKNAFAHYVSKDLIENVISNPEALKLGGERRNISVLFLDFENFTSLSETLEPKKVVEIINKYFDAFSNLIMESGGTVDKFEGDAIMAIFGAPIIFEDHALKACSAALKIREKIKELNSENGYNLNLRIGLSSGDAIVGNMGSRERFDYTAMGDIVNTASRLEGINKFYNTRALVNEEFFTKAKDKFSFREIDLICPKGKKDAIRIYELLGPIESLTEEGKKVIELWHEALAAYRNSNWRLAEEKIQEVISKMPEDGPSKTFLKRIEAFKLLAPKKWNGIWRFEEK